MKMAPTPRLMPKDDVSRSATLCYGAGILRQMVSPILLIAMITLLAQCSRNQTAIPANNNLESAFSQKYLFEVEYVNFAWGYTHYGFFIDSSGNVFEYRYSSNDTPWAGIKRKSVSEQQLEQKFSHNMQWRYRLEKEKVYAHSKLIPFTLNAQYSDTTYPLVDAGQKSYLCYYQNAQNGDYQIIKLAVNGDMSYNNQSTAAQILVQWLMQCESLIKKNQKKP